jgi:hypothetical protein
MRIDIVKLGSVVVLGYQDRIMRESTAKTVQRRMILSESDYSTGIIRPCNTGTPEDHYIVRRPAPRGVAPEPNFLPHVPHHQMPMAWTLLAHQFRAWLLNVVGCSISVRNPRTEPPACYAKNAGEVRGKAPWLHLEKLSISSCSEAPRVVPSLTLTLLFARIEPGEDRCSRLFVSEPADIPQAKLN